jgi:hypothetical protein
MLETMYLLLELRGGDEPKMLSIQRECSEIESPSKGRRRSSDQACVIDLEGN